jgi:hypothetical protein
MACKGLRLFSKSLASIAPSAFHARMQVVLAETAIHGARTMSVSPPINTYARTNPRHRIMVEYTAYGKAPREIAEATGYSEQYVYAIQRSPLFQTEVASAQDDIKRGTLAKFAEKLAEETLPSLTTLTGIRDNTNARDTDRVSAADKVIGRALDLYLPRGRNGDGDGKRTVKLVIEGGDLGALANAIREADGKPALEASATTISVDDDAYIRPVTIDEMIENDRQEESQ